MADQSEVIAFLSEPRSYGPEVAAVERHETHGSIVFLAGDRAYKLKRNVTYPYMDYGTLEQRRLMCERELTINRRTAPMLYLGVMPVLRCASGQLALAGSKQNDDVVEWLVVMRRFEQASLLDDMRRHRRLTIPLVRQAVEEIARFHAAAEVTPEFGGAAAIAAVVAQNCAAFHAKLDAPFRRPSVTIYEKRAKIAAAAAAPLLEARRSGGLVRRCHGDLHLNNICLVDGRPVPFDAIEFNDAFSCIDVLYDTAFLIMDLHRCGLAGHATAALNRYLERTSDYAGLAAMPLFLSCRAGVRAHVAVSTAEALAGAEEKLNKLAEAEALLELANAYLAPGEPRLIAVGGLSGTGKSTFAYGLAPLLAPGPGAIVIRSDIVRKRLMGVEETARLPQSAYTFEVTEQVYQTVTRLADTALAAGYSVIADAVFGKAGERSAVAEIARRHGRRFTGVWLEAPREVLEQRVSARSGDASDATVDVVRAQERFVGKPADWLCLDAAVPAFALLESASERLQLNG